MGTAKETQCLSFKNGFKKIEKSFLKLILISSL